MVNEKQIWKISFDIIDFIQSSYNALYPPNVGAQSAVHIHITDKEYNTQYMLIADTFTVHRETELQVCTRTAVRGIRLSRQCGIYTPHQYFDIIQRISIVRWLDYQKKYNLNFQSVWVF